MGFASATDLAIRTAIRKNTMVIHPCVSNYGLGTYYAICDEGGMIETHNTADEAKARIESIKKGM
jgi:hypothetical protein